MVPLKDFVSSHLGEFGLVIFVVCVGILLIVGMVYIQSRRLALLSDRLDDMTRGAQGESFEGLLNTHLDTVLRVAHDLDELAVRTAIVEGGARLHFARLGLVRFNPFNDTGGDQSFALAILDSNNDGFVVSSLHSRTGTRLYAKAIFGGESDMTLGGEEAQAVAIACSQGETPSGKPAKGRKGGSATGRQGTGKMRSSTAPKPDADAGQAVAQAPAGAVAGAAAKGKPAADGAGAVDSVPVAAAGDVEVFESEAQPAEAGPATPPA